jgi:hypothetical protein
MRSTGDVVRHFRDSPRGVPSRIARPARGEEEEGGDFQSEEEKGRLRGRGRSRFGPLIMAGWGQWHVTRFVSAAMVCITVSYRNYMDHPFSFLPRCLRK